MKQCPNCQEWVEDSQKFCTRCGASLTSMAPGGLNTPPMPGTSGQTDNWSAPAASNMQGYGNPSGYGQPESGNFGMGNAYGNNPYGPQPSGTGDPGGLNSGSSKKQKGFRKAKKEKRAAGYASGSRYGSPYSAAGQNYGKKKSSRTIKIVVSVCVVLALIIGGVAAWLIVPDKLYDSRVAEGIELLHDKEYDEAIDKLKSARKLKPKRLEAYEHLYAAACAKESTTDQEEIRTLAKENLDQSDRVKFGALTQEIDEEYEPGEAYHVLKDLGKLDFAPIHLGITFDDPNERGWLICQNGVYSFVTINGDIRTINHDDAEYARMELANDGGGYSLAASGSEEVLVYPESLEQYRSQASESAGENHAGVFTLDEYGELVTVMDNPAVDEKGLLNDWDAQGFLMVTQEDEDDCKHRVFDTDDSGGSNPFLSVYDRESAALLNDQEYYLYEMTTRRTIGPFAADEESCFGHAHLKNPNLKVETISPSMMNPLQYAGTVCAKKETDSKTGEESWTLYGKDSAELNGFQDVEFVSQHTIGAFRRSRFYLYNNMLEPIYDGRFEGGSVPISGNAIVKTDGTWKLIRFASADAEKVNKVSVAMQNIGVYMESPYETRESVKSLAEEQLYLLHPQYGSVREPEYYIDSVRFYEDDDLSSLPEGELLILNPESGFITWAENSIGGKPDGLTVQIFMNPKEGTAKLVSVNQAQCVRGDPDSFSTARYTEDAEENEAIWSFYQGHAKDNLYEGAVQSIAVYYDDAIQISMNFKNGKMVPVRDMTPEEEREIGYSGFAVTKEGADTSIFYPDKSRDRQYKALYVGTALGALAYD